jgi:nucleoside-diphosphate kinase
MSTDLVLGFELEWFDPVAGLLKPLFLRFFINDNTIEILEDKRTFLKRIFYPDVQLSHLFVGNSITVFNRLLLVKNYCNVATEKYLKALEAHFLVTVSSNKKQELGKIFTLAAGPLKLSIGKVRTTSTSILQPGFSIDSGDFLLELVSFSGGKDSDSIKAQFESISDRGIYVDLLPYQRIGDIMNECTVIEVPEFSSLLVIKPHALKTYKVGDIITDLLEAGFSIGALNSSHFSDRIAEELFDIYRNVYVGYNAMIEHVCSGTVLSLMVQAPHGEEDVVAKLRDVCGPLNPELARVLRPHSIRAKYGIVTEQNAVHCTDCTEDGSMECRYIFNTLSSL